MQQFMKSRVQFSVVIQSFIHCIQKLPARVRSHSMIVLLLHAKPMHQLPFRNYYCVKQMILGVGAHIVRGTPRFRQIKYLRIVKKQLYSLNSLSTPILALMFTVLQMAELRELAHQIASNKPSIRELASLRLVLIYTSPPQIK